MLRLIHIQRHSRISQSLSTSFSNYALSNSTQRVVMERNKKWKNMLNELKEYREKHGHTMVPIEYELNPKLGAWVDSQRQYYKRDSLSEERMEMLQNEGFVFDVHNEIWQDRYNELVEYKEKHGDCNVPHTPEYHELWTWVFVQRRMYSIRMSGKKSSMTDHRISQLEKLGFVWNLNDYSWIIRFEELKTYKANHGDCLVPKLFEPNPALAKWVEMQRTQYKNLQMGKRSFLTPERIKLLENIGFVWNVHDLKWMLKYKELLNFFMVNGHCNVPVKHNKPLVNWMGRQRKEYHKFLNNEKSQLNEKRIILLQKTGLLLNDRYDVQTER